MKPANITTHLLHGGAITVSRAEEMDWLMSNDGLHAMPTGTAVTRKPGDKGETVELRIQRSPA